MKYLVPLLFLVGCSSSEFVSGTVTAKNGHSIVSEYNKTSELECTDGGTRLDLYIDTDDSLSATEGDVYSNSIISCNGENGKAGLDGTNGEDGATGSQGPQGLQGMIGPQGMPGSTGAQGPAGPAGAAGPQGIQGPTGSSGATIKAYTSSNCTLITGSSLYVKIKSNTASIYTSSSCASNTKLEEINEGHSYFVSANMLLVYSEEVARVITFN